MACKKYVSLGFQRCSAWCPTITIPAGAWVSLSVMVTPSAVANPTGTVTFYDNGVSIGTGTLSGAATDTATFTTSILSTATHPITAQYTSGDTNFNTSAASPSISQVVNKASTTAVVSSSVDPSVSGQGAPSLIQAFSARISLSCSLPRGGMRAWFRWS